MDRGERVNVSRVADAPPDAYDRHVGRYGAQLAAELIGIAGVRAGQRALDVGCGTGALTVALAALVGEANVAAIDPSERFVDVCRSRVPGADVRVATAESIPFADASFDAVLAQLVVDGLTDARGALAEMRRVARPDAVVAACVWNYDGGMTLLGAVWDAARALDLERARSFGADRRLPFSRPAELEKLWRTAGLDHVEVGKLVVGAEYADLDDLWYPFAAGVGALGSFVQSLDKDARVRMKRLVATSLGDPEAPFRLSAEAWYVSGRV